MTKDELINAVHDSLRTTHCRHLGKDEIKTVVEHTLDTIKGTVHEGEDVTLRGFGYFKAKQRKAKTARNISAGTTIELPARKVVAFKPSKDFTVKQA